MNQESSVSKGLACCLLLGPLQREKVVTLCTFAAVSTYSSVFCLPPGAFSVGAAVYQHLATTMKCVEHRRTNGIILRRYEPPPGKF